MNQKKQTLKETFVEAFKSYKKKEYEKAEIYCYKIISIDPYHIDSLSLLATISALNANHSKAKTFLDKVIEIQPNNINALHNLGTVYKELGKIKEAINLFEKVLIMNPEHINANYNLGLMFYELDDAAKAKIYLQKTVSIQSNYALAFFSLGNVHVELKEFENAISCYQKAIEINPNIVGAHNNLGLVFRRFNDYENAISCYEKAIKIQPNHSGAHHNLALTFKEQGNFEKAIKSHKAAIKYEPENLTHYHFLSELKDDVLDLTLKEKIVKIITTKSTQTNQAYGNYLLAKYERKAKNYKKELDYLIKGHLNFFNSRKKKFNLGVKYCFEDVIQIAENISVEKSDQNNEEELNPIFIIGVPRCGSTLVEKIIGSNEKNVSSGEETQVLENYVNKKILENKSLNLGSETIVRSDLYSIYNQKGLISKINKYVFTDKSLNNFFYLKLINKIYPKAKIINCRRDNLSSIMSIFQNNLTELAWTHNLENIFKYFNNYFKILVNYKKNNSNSIYELRFENLVNNPEEESKKLMKFCGLPWDKNCLEFYKKKNLISKTASNIQIRKPIYKHSQDKYFPYKALLNKYGKKYSWFK